MKEKTIICLEEYLGFCVRYIPGYTGMQLRRFVYRLTFKHIGVYALSWPNVYITHGFNIIAGDFLAINYGAHLDGRGGITLGDYVLIGPNVFIGSSNHIVQTPNGRPRIFSGHEKKPVTIGSNIWIGANAVICPGVTIGNNSVIAAGSVVIKDIPESTLVAGNPASVIRSIAQKK